MSQSDSLNFICAGFPRCGTTALSKYFEQYTDVKVLKDPDSGAYEFNVFTDTGINDYYDNHLLGSNHIFHKFSGYTYVKEISELLSSVYKLRHRTIVIFMLGDQYERLQSWHAFHRSKAISGTDKSHFTYANRDFYANCSLTEYYHEFAGKRIDYLTTLQRLAATLDNETIFVIKQNDLRHHPEQVLDNLSKKLGFTLRPITQRLIVNSSVLEPGISLEADDQLKVELGMRQQETLSWVNDCKLLVDVASLNNSLPQLNIHRRQAIEPIEQFTPVQLCYSHKVNHNSVLVIGNGPSASLVNFDRLKRLSIPTCGMNSAYRLWQKIDFRPTYYICMDSVVIKSHAPAISGLIDENRIHHFFLRNEILELYPHFRHHPRITWFDDIRAEKTELFTTNWITTGSWALRWMIYLDYKVICVIGVDANYQEILKETKQSGQYELSINQTPKYNPNYFFDDYQQVGDKYNIPNDPQYVAKHGTTVHADAVRKVREDSDKLFLSNQVFDLSPLSEHNAFPKLSISKFLDYQEVSLTTSFYYKLGKEEEARLNADALCFNLQQFRVTSINLLFEGDFLGFRKILDSRHLEIIDESVHTGKLRVVNIFKRPSYLNLFHAAKSSDAQIAIVTNSDLIYSDELIEKLCTSYSIQSSYTVYCITRWNQTDKGTFIQGQVPAPPWQELPLDKLHFLSDVNYLSYDTYVFNKSLCIPDSFSEIYIGTFGCDTAIAAVLRAAGYTVTNPCLDLTAIHLDNKPRDYSGDAGSRQVLANVEAFKQTILAELNALFQNNDILEELEAVRSNSLNIGTPSHALGWWYCLFRMFGASPWMLSTNSPTINFVKFSIDPDSLLQSQEELSKRLCDAMRKGNFLEIIVNGNNGDHYLGCFDKSNLLKEIKNQLFRYDRQYVLFEDDIDERVRRKFDKFMLFVRSQFQGLPQGSALNLYSFTPSTQLTSLSSPCPLVDKVSNTSDALSLPVLDRYHNSKSAFSPHSVKILIIDPTPLGSHSATGQIKKVFFGQYDSRNILQVWEHTGTDPGLRLFSPSESKDPNAIPQSVGTEAILEAINVFNPSVVYFRSTASEALHGFHHLIIDTLNIPSIIHIMDDWEARMLLDQSPNQSLLSQLLIKSIGVSQVRLTICAKMSSEFTERYSCNWFELANAVEVASHAPPNRPDLFSADNPQDPLVIKYMGGLAPDMNAQSIFEVASTIQELRSEGFNVRFEIYTMKWYMDWANKHLSCFESVAVYPLVPFDEYYDALVSADILLIAYSFDIKSVAYTRLSMANKLPEILAAGKLLFAYGPLEIATIEHVSNNDLGIVVGVRDTTLLRDRLRQVILDDELRRNKANRGYDFARSHYSLAQTRRKFNALLGLAASKKHRLC